MREAGTAILPAPSRICDSCDQGITKWPGDILSYKEHLRTQINKSLKAFEKSGK